MKQYRLLERQHPIFSPVALLSTAVLIAVLAVFVWLTGGRAFSPGELSALNRSGAEVGGFKSHAEFSDDCGECHEPFAGVTVARCESCHENITAQREGTVEGVHGRIDPTEVTDCATCHLEHRGADYDLLQAAIVHFDHGVTRFSLTKHATDYDGLTIACDGCHADDRSYDIKATACRDCHEVEAADFIQIHVEAYGEDCVGCHDGLDTMADFTMEKHAEVFPLTGLHLETTCESCHADAQFEDLPQECAGCHAEPAVHEGLFAETCEECHSTDGWKPATLEGEAFAHEQNTRFSLVGHVTNYDGEAFNCTTCHAPDTDFAFVDADCEGCHAPAEPEFMTQHVAQFGRNCLECHDGTGSMENFDHSQYFPLTGQHEVIECQACHTDQVFEGTPTECAACHAEPLIHAGLFGLQCELCHSTSAWLPAQLTSHTFPLDHGGDGEIDCATCHLASYTEYTCYGCHEHEEQEMIREHREEGISAEELVDCVQCHPTGHEDEAEEHDD